jgi:hypothetical protein
MHFKPVVTTCFVDIVHYVIGQCMYLIYYFRCSMVNAKHVIIKIYVQQIPFTLLRFQSQEAIVYFCIYIPTIYVRLCRFYYKGVHFTSTLY